jgi:hypothetical protein
MSGPWRQVQVKGETKWQGQDYIARYYKLIVIPVFALWIAIWIVAAYVPREVRGTNQIVRMGAIVGLFHGVMLGVLVVLWWLLSERSLSDFFRSGRFYHVFVLWIALWIVAACVRKEVRGTRQVLKIGAAAGLFLAAIFGLVVVFWWRLGEHSLGDFYSDAKFYHGQWTGLWLFPVTGVILTGYLFGTMAGWLAKGVERLRGALVGQPVERSARSA